MEECKIKNLYNLEETIAKELLENCTYPWEALPQISEFILKIGPTLNKEIYEGAKNRVRNLKKYAKENNISADLFLGIESGINDLLGRWMITNIAVIEDNEDFESYGTSPSFPVPDNLVQKVLDTNLSEAMDTVLGEDKERHNHSGGIQLLTHNKISRIDLTEYAFIMALTKYINGEKWR